MTITWAYLQSLTQPQTDIVLVEQICAFLRKEGCLGVYTVNYKGVVSVVGSVKLNNRELQSIPVYFSHVRWFFDCSYNKLTTLIGCPNKVGIDFLCDNNRLTTLIVGGAIKIVGEFDCSHNPLKTLYGMPSCKHKKFDDTLLTSNKYG
jgi:hypothetical protein